MFGFKKDIQLAHLRKLIMHLHCLPKCTALKSEGYQLGFPLSHYLLLFNEFLSFEKRKMV